MRRLLFQHQDFKLGKPAPERLLCSVRSFTRRQLQAMHDEMLKQTENACCWFDSESLKWK